MDRRIDHDKGLWHVTGPRGTAGARCTGAVGGTLVRLPEERRDKRRGVPHLFDGGGGR